MYVWVDSSSELAFIDVPPYTLECCYPLFMRLVDEAL